MDVVQLRFLQLHSLTSFQHMTIRCTANNSSGAGTTNSINRIIHFLGDSGIEIISHLTTVSRKDCEVRLKELVVKNTDYVSLAAFSTQVVPSIGMKEILPCF